MDMFTQDLNVATEATQVEEPTRDTDAAERRRHAPEYRVSSVMCGRTAYEAVYEPIAR